MKKTTFIATMLAATLAAGPILAAAPADSFSAKRSGTWERGEFRGHERGLNLERMAKKLDLSAEQQEQIRAMLADHRSRTAPLRQELRESRRQMRNFVKVDVFDESAVRALALEQVDARTELIVERARMRQQIYAVLSPEQRNLAERRWKEHRSPRDDVKAGRK